MEPPRPVESAAHAMWRSPQALLVGGFAGLILIGTVLLALPVSHAAGHTVGWLDAAFTATSAVCVTGLATTSTDALSGFGQLVLLVLIQVGGLGILTFAAAAVQLLRGRLSLRASAALADTLLQRDGAREMRHLFWRICRMTLAIEAVGTVVLFLPWWVYGAHAGVHGPGAAAWAALFHAISAFCNAGFALHPESLEPFRTNGWILVPMALLIITGGLGHAVLVELWRWLTRRETDSLMRWSTHTRVVLSLSIGLTVAGFVAFWFFGTRDVADPQVPTDWWTRAWDALFATITARTAGFSTAPMGTLPSAALFVMICLMFVGGSPGSCAGGVKTTTVAIAFAEMRAGLRGQADALLGGRRLPPLLVRRALLLLGVAVAWNVTGVLVLLVTEGRPLDDVLFEQVSALGTVGLSTGLTPFLSPIGKLWIMLTMFVGRLGPLTIGVWVIARTRGHVRHPEGRVMIG